MHTGIFPDANTVCDTSNNNHIDGGNECGVVNIIESDDADAALAISVVAITDVNTDNEKLLYFRRRLPPFPSLGDKSADTDAGGKESAK